MVKRAEQEKLIQKAVDVVDSQKLVDLTIELTNIASPTGQEGEIARTYFERLEESGMRSVLQPIGDDRYNALGVLDGEGGGRSLMYNGHLVMIFPNVVWVLRLRGNWLMTNGSLGWVPLI